MGRPGVLAVESNDPVLSAIAPIGLAASVGTALVIDLDGGLRIGSDRTLADLVEHGPSKLELSPGRSGVAMISGSHVDPVAAVEVVDLLASSWPAVVLRSNSSSLPYPKVPVRALFPGFLSRVNDLPAVWQPVGTGNRPSGPGPVLPGLTSRLVRRLLNGGLPRRSRWINSWAQVWDLPWG